MMHCGIEHNSKQVIRSKRHGKGTSLPRVKRWGRRICFPQFLPKGSTSALERCDASWIVEVTKAATKASPYSPMNTPQGCIHFSTQGVVQGSTTFTQGQGKLHNIGGSQLHHGEGSRLQPPDAPTTGILPTEDFPTRILPTEDLGLQGFPMETTPNSNPFGRWVDLALLQRIPK